MKPFLDQDVVGPERSPEPSRGKRRGAGGDRGVEGPRRDEQADVATEVAAGESVEHNGGDDRAGKCDGLRPRLEGERENERENELPLH